MARFQGARGYTDNSDGGTTSFPPRREDFEYQRTLGTLSAMAGPSGFEHPVAEQAAGLMRPFLDEANVDRFECGGVRLLWQPGAPRLLLMLI